MMLPFGPPPAPGWLPMLPVVGAAPAPARGVVPGPAPAGWLPLPRPRGAAALAPFMAGAPAARRRGARAGRLGAAPCAARRRGRTGAGRLATVRAAAGPRAAALRAAAAPAAPAAVVTPPVTPPHEQQRRAIPFVAQLKRMIEERPEIIRWRRGDIVIPDPAALERNLSKYYKHSKYASFQRQLNNFGYRRQFAPGGGDAAETVYERQGASENLDDLLALRPVRPAPVKKRGRDEPPASPK